MLEALFIFFSLHFLCTLDKFSLHVKDDNVVILCICLLHTAFNVRLMCVKVDVVNLVGENKNVV